MCFTNDFNFVVLFRSCFGFGVDIGFNINCVAFEHCGENGSKLLGQLVGCLADVEELFEVAVVPEFNGPALAHAELHRTEIDRVGRVDQVFGKHVFDVDWDAVLVGLFLFSVFLDFEDDARGVFVPEPLVLSVFEVEVYIRGCAGSMTPSRGSTLNILLDRLDAHSRVNESG